MKKTVSLLLAMLMLLSTLAIVPVSAETTSAITPDTSWYNASATTFNISTAAQFLGLVQLAQENDFSGKTINLTADIDLNPGTDCSFVVGTDGKCVNPTAPANTVQMIPSWKGIFDGNGHSITGIYAQQDMKSATEFALIKDLYGTVKNLVIYDSLVYAYSTGADSVVAGGAYLAGVAVYMRSGSVLENLYLDLDVIHRSWSAMNLGTVACKMIEAPITFRNIVYVGKVGGFMPNRNMSTSTGMKFGQLFSDQNWKIGVVIDNVTIADTPYVAVATNKIAASNEKLSDPGMTTRPANIVIGKYATVEAAKTAGGLINYNTDKADNVDMVYSKTVGGIIPTSVSAMIDDETKITPDTSWYTDSATTFNISTAAQFLGLFQLAQTKSFAGKTVNLTADIDLNPGVNCSVDISAAGKATFNSVFNKVSMIPTWSGTLNGNGHSIKGLYMEKDFGTGTGNLALIGEMNGTLKNLSLLDSMVYAYSSTNSYSNLAGGCTLCGIAINLNANATLENLYLDLDVIHRSWSKQTVCTIAYAVTANPVVIRNVAFVGNVGGFKPNDYTVNSSEDTVIYQLFADQNWKSELVLDNIALLQTYYSSGTNGKAVSLHEKLSSADMVFRPANILNGKYATVAAAVSAGKITNYNTEKAGKVDMVYSTTAEGVIPASVAAMISTNVVLQTSTPSEDKFNVRILNTVETLDWTTAGFYVTIKVNGETKVENKKFTTTGAFTSVIADGVTYSASALDEEAIAVYGLVITNLPAQATDTVELTITAFHQSEFGGEILGNKTATVTFVGGINQ